MPLGFAEARASLRLPQLGGSKAEGLVPLVPCALHLRHAFRNYAQWLQVSFQN